MSERDPYAVLGVGREATPATSSPRPTGAWRAATTRTSRASRTRSGGWRRSTSPGAILRDPDRRAAWDRGHGDAGVPSDRARPGARHPATGRQPAGARNAPAVPSPGAAARPARAPPGPPPGNPRGSVLPFGRHIGWSLGEIARIDPGYLAWLAVAARAPATARRSPP